jgi:hypothetical protein
MINSSHYKTILKKMSYQFFSDFVGFYSGSEKCIVQIWFKFIQQGKTAKVAIMSPWCHFGCSHFMRRMKMSHFWASVETLPIRDCYFMRFYPIPEYVWNTMSCFDFHRLYYTSTTSVSTSSKHRTGSFRTLWCGYKLLVHNRSFLVPYLLSYALNSVFAFGLHAFITILNFH